MSNPYYNVTGTPATASQGASSPIRAEFAAIAAAFALLPVLSGNALYTVRVNAGGAALEAVAPTGTGAPVNANTPTLITPNIGAATGTSLTVSGQLTSSVATGTPPLVVSSTTQVANLYASRAALADTVTVNANLSGVVTSSGNTTSFASTTGSGAVVLATAPTISNPTLTTPTLGVASGTSLALGGGTPLTTTNQTGTGNLVLQASPTLTGTVTVDNITITSASGGLICAADGIHSVTLAGGSSGTNGSRIVLQGPGSGLSGQAFIIADNGSVSTTLLLKQDGTFTWGGNSVWTAGNLAVTAPTSWTPIFTPGAGAFGTVTINYAKYARINGLTYFQIDATVAQGTASGTLTVSLGTTPAGGGLYAFRGRDINNGTGLMGIVTSGTTSMSVTNDSNSSPIQANMRFSISGFYP